MREDGSTAPVAQGDKPLLRNWKFITAINADSELLPSAAKVALALLDIHNNEDGYARPGHKLIAQRAGTDVSTVKRALASLKERGWFCIAEAWTASGDQDTNRYYPIWKRAEGQAPAGSERPRKARSKPAEPDQTQDQAQETGTEQETIYQIGPALFTKRELQVIQKELGASFPEFKRQVERLPAELPRREWRKSAAAIYTELMEPVPF